jgi:hypothetical protein
VLHAMAANGADGFAMEGHVQGCGTVYQITP